MAAGIVTLQGVHELEEAQVARDLVCRQREDAEDITQDALLSVFRNLKQLQARSASSRGCSASLRKTVALCRESGQTQVLPPLPAELREKLREAYAAQSKSC